MMQRHYHIRGRFASRGAFTVADLPVPALSEPAPETHRPNWYSSMAFLSVSLALIFMMCAVGRAGA